MTEAELKRIDTIEQQLKSIIDEVHIKVGAEIGQLARELKALS